MDKPSKEENNNLCSNQGIDAVVNNNTQEETAMGHSLESRNL